MSNKVTMYSLSIANFGVLVYFFTHPQFLFLETDDNDNQNVKDPSVKLIDSLNMNATKLNEEQLVLEEYV